MHHIRAVSCRWLRTAIACAFSTVFAQAAWSGVILNTLDSSTEGWTGNFTVSHQTSGGNPGGWLLQAGNLAGAVLNAPATYHGDLTGFDGGVFSWDSISTEIASGLRQTVTHSAVSP